MRQYLMLIGRILFSILLALITLVSFAINTSAQVLIPDGELPSDQVLSDDAIIFGENVRIDGNVDGDLIAIGTDVEINGTITGSLILLGRDLTLNGEVEGSVYSLGGTLDVGPDSKIGRNVYFGGLRLATKPGSQISRDLVAAALQGNISGQVNRNLKSVFGLLEIADILREGVENEVYPEKIPSPTDNPGSEQNQGSTYIIPDNGFIQSKVINNRMISSGYTEQVGELEIRNAALVQTDNPTSQTEMLLKWLHDRLNQFIPFLIIGLLLIWLFPINLDDWANTLRSKPLQSTGYGLLGLVIALNGFVIFVILAVILLAIGLGLGYVSLWNIVYYLWGIGYSSLVLLFFLYSLFVFYISKIILAYMGGTLILNRLSPKISTNKIFALIIGILIYVLLLAIPYLGWVFGILGIILGLGSVWLVLRSQGKNNDLEAQVIES